MGKPTIYIYLYPSPLPNTELFNSPKNITHLIIWSSGWIIYSENKGKGLSHLPYKAWCWWTEKIFVELSKNAEMNCFLGSPLRWRCWEVFRYNNALVVCLLDDYKEKKKKKKKSAHAALSLIMALGITSNCIKLSLQNKFFLNQAMTVLPQTKISTPKRSVMPWKSRISSDLNITWAQSCVTEHCAYYFFQLFYCSLTSAQKNAFISINHTWMVNWACGRGSMLKMSLGCCRTLNICVCDRVS